MAVGAAARVAEAYPADHAMAYGHDPEAMRACIDERSRVVFVANPNNPTGTWLNSTELEDFIKSVPENVLVVVDEAYSEYVDESDYPDAISWIERFPNLVVTRTFSKIYGLAGLRVGYAVSHPQVADLLNRVRQPFNVNMPAQAAAVASLEDSEHLRRSREQNRTGLHRLRVACDVLGLNYLPSAGNFLCVNMKQSGRAVFEALLRKGVIVRPVDNYGLPDFLRITIGSERENARLIKALEEILKS